MSAPPITSTWQGNLESDCRAQLPGGSLSVPAGLARRNSFCSKGTHLPLCSQPLGVGGLPEALHAHSVQLHHALCQWHQVQDAPKGLCTTAGRCCWVGSTRVPKQLLYQNDCFTFLWKVPSRAATMTVFPALAIVSQNSTMSGNWRGYRHSIKRDEGQHLAPDPTVHAQTAAPGTRKIRAMCPVCEMDSSPTVLCLQGL